MEKALLKIGGWAWGEAVAAPVVASRTVGWWVGVSREVVLGCNGGIRGGIPSKVHWFESPAEAAAALAAAIMAGELSVPWRRPVPCERIWPIWTSRTPSGQGKLRVRYEFG